MSGVLSTSVQRPFSFIPLVGKFPFHESRTRARPSPVSDISLAPLFIYPALPLFDLSLLSLVSLLISKDVDFVELPRIPRGFLKATALLRLLAIYNVSPGRETGSFIRATLLIFNPGRSFIRERSLEHCQHIGISFACHSASTGRKITKQHNRRINKIPDSHAHRSKYS